MRILLVSTKKGGSVTLVNFGVTLWCWGLPFAVEKTEAAGLAILFLCFRFSFSKQTQGEHLASVVTGLVNMGMMPKPDLPSTVLPSGSDDDDMFDDEDDEYEDEEEEEEEAAKQPA